MRTTQAPDTSDRDMRRPGHRRRWAVLAIGVAAQASFALTWLGLSAATPTLRFVLRLPLDQLGQAMSCLLFGIAVTEVPWGALTDRLGERRVLVGGLLATGLGLAATAAFAVPASGHGTRTGLLMVVLFFVGALGGSVNGASGRAVLSWFPPGQRGFAMSVRQTAVPLGGAAGALMVPLAATWLGASGIFACCAAACLAAAVFAVFGLAEPPTAQPTRPVTRAPQPRRIPVLANVTVLRIALTGGMLTFSQFAVVSFAGVFLGDARHLSPAVLPVLLAGMQVLGGVVRIGSGFLTDRHGGRSNCLRGIALAAAAVLVLVAIGGHGPAWALAAGLCVAGILVSGWHGIAYVAIAEAGAPRSGTALGVLNTGAFVAGLCAPLTVAPLLAHTSWPMVWVVGAACCAIAAAAMPTVPDAVTRPAAR